MAREEPKRPIAAVGHMPFPGHRTQAETAAGERRGGAASIIASFRPAHGDILVMTHDQGDHAGTVLSLGEARAVHGALGRALALAG